MSRNSILIGMLAACALGGCGFTPLYADRAGSPSVTVRDLNVIGVTGPDSVAPTVLRILEDRVAAAPEREAEFDIAIEVEESAQRLAVQIDASVTRFNYFLRGEYTLIRRADAREFTGAAETVASFNVVTSQYSTLFAEDAAREKAARALVEGIERDILLKLSNPKAQTAARPRTDRRIEVDPAALERDVVRTPDE